jgi:hypothetical protein
MKKIAFILLAGSALFFGSCTKTGPQGPQGPQGQQGPQGNANVKGSDPFTVSSWQFNGTEVAYEASFTDPDITASVADHGVVEIFLYYPSDQTWRPLPDVYSGTEFYFRYNLGSFDIYFANLDGSTPSFPGTFTFRSVVIAPGYKQSHPNVNWKNYNEVMAAYNDQAATSKNISTGN